MPQAKGVGQVVDVFYSTTRSPEIGASFGVERSLTPTYGKVGISVPPEHAQGKLEVNGRHPDPTQDFVATEELLFDDSAAFRRDLAAALRKNPTHEAVIFVHGFNNNFAEGLFRIAQLRHDFGIQGVAVHYAWPSHGSPLGYAYDRDSALFARDGLEDLIRQVKAAGATSVLLVGHSIGAALSMEAMRQISIKSPAELHRDIDAVVLISPDIDVDVFRAQATRIEKLPEPFFIFVSKRDKALALSARLTGEKNRLGNAQSVTQISDLAVTMVDVSQFTGPFDLGHFTVGSSPALIRILAQLPRIDAVIKGDTAGRTGLLTGTVLTVQNATEIVLSPITALAGSALQQ